MRAAKSMSKRMTWIIASLVLLLSQITPILLATGSVKAFAGDMPSNPSCTALVGAPCITADKSDYAPTDTIVITGFGFVAGIQYNLAIRSSNGAFNVVNPVMADGAGAISVSQPLDGVYRPNYTATISDLQGNIIATTNFTDSRTINSATVGGSSSTTVSPGASVPAVVNVSTNGSGSDDDWECTGWQITGGGSGTSTGINITSDATTNHNFNVTAPSSAGTYNIVFTAYSSNNCSSGASTPFTLNNAIIVVAPISITAVTVDGSANPSVDPGEVVPVVVNATVAAGTNWRSTEWQIDGGNWNCEDTADKGTGLQNVTFNMTTPITLGAHTFNVRAYTNNGCSSGQSPTFSLANTVNVTIVANPVLLDSCGLDIALVIDSSSSIDSTELSQMKAAYVAFLNAFLPATATQFSVTDFDTTANVVQTFTSNLTTLTTAVNSPSSGGFTNWQDGLLKAQSTFDPRPGKQNLVIFASDGNPNTIGNGPADNAGTEAVAVNAAVGVANTIKNSGTRVMALGIGNSLNIDNLKAVSGPVADAGVGSDVITSGFSTLATDLSNLAKQLCGGTITVQKLIDIDGNIQNTSDQTPASGWTFDVDGSPSNPAATQTGSDGYTPSVKVENGTYSVTEITNQGYNLISASCSGASNNGSLNGNSITGIQLGSDQIVSCKFINSPKPATLIVNKVIKNDNGGTKVASNFSYQINGATAVPFESDGSNTQTVATGTYTIAEVQANQNGYITSYEGCENVQIALGETKICTITNDDVAAGLTLVKNLVKNNGGTANATDWTLKATGSSALPTNLSGATGTAGATSGSNFKADTYTLSEANGPTGYSPSLWTCTNNVVVTNAQITLANGQSTTCTITNDDDAPGLTLIKQLGGNLYGATALTTQWTLTATGPTAVTGAGGVTSDESFNAGTYTLSETSGTWTTKEFSASGWDCVGGSLIGTALTVALGEQATCTITNSAVQPKLTVTKVVDNGNTGATKVTSDFPLFVGATSVISGDKNGYNVGDYTVSETPDPGYSAVISGACSANGAVTLALGDDKACTITNTAIAPTLKLVKVAINDNGGTVKADAFNLTAAGQNFTGNNITTVGATTTTDAYTVSGVKVGANNKVTISETPTTGYALTSIVCKDGSNNVVASNNNATSLELTLALAQNITCTVTNNDIVSALTLIKELSGNYTVGASINDWTLIAKNGSDTTVLSGTSGVNGSVNADSYTLSESSVKYADWQYSSSWACKGNTNGSLVEDVLAISLGQDVTCTVTNELKPATLIVKKVVINDNGGSAKAVDFSFNYTPGGSSTQFVKDGIDSNGLNTLLLNAGTYSVTEDQANEDGYVTTYDNCTNITIANGETKTCTITNDDQQSYVIVDKSVEDNSAGGTAQPNDFNLTVNGNAALDGVKVPVNPGTHTVGETTLPGYQASSWGGDCSKDAQVTVALGETKTCTITNTAIAPKLTLKKYVVNNNSGENNSSDWILTAAPEDDAYATISGNGDYEDEGGVYKKTAVANVAYQLSEDGPDGYAAGDWNCYGEGSDFENDVVTLSLGANITCTITNDDVAHPSISVEKYGPATAYEGDTVTYTFIVTNTGDTYLADLTVVDDIATDMTCASESLARGDYTICTATYEIPAGQVENVINHVEACGVYYPSTDSTDKRSSYYEEQGTEVCDTDDHELDVLHPSIKVVKAGPATASAGDTVTYTFTVTNTGDTPLGPITVVDNIAGNGVYQSGDTNNDDILQVEETWIYTAKYTIPAGSKNQVNNTVKACGSELVLEQEFSDNVRILNVNSDAIVQPVNETAPVCDEDTHTLSIPEVLVNTGTPLSLGWAIGAVMLFGALVMAAPRNRFQATISRK